MKALILATWIVSVSLGLVGITCIGFTPPYLRFVGLFYIAITGYVCVATLIKLDDQ